MPFEAKTFDIVLSFQVIEHIKDDKSFIKEANRVLHDGGILFITTPNKNYRQVGKKPLNPYHVREYSPDELLRIIKEVIDDKSKIRLYGIFGNDEIQKIEKERFDRIRKIHSYDKFNLRKITPLPIKSLVKKILSKRYEHNKKYMRMLDKKYDLNDFFISDKNISDSLDLLIQCEK